MEAEGMMQVQIEDMILTVDVETGVQLENDIHFRKQYIETIRRQIHGDNVRSPQQESNDSERLWSSSKIQTSKDKEATLFFLSLRKKYADEFSDKSTNKNSIWTKIANKMNERNFNVGYEIDGREKCRQKFANLQASFIRYIDRKRQTGEGKIPKPVYFDEMQEILGSKHKTNPVLVIDSLKNNNSSTKPELSKSEHMCEKMYSVDNSTTPGTSNEEEDIAKESMINARKENKYDHVKSTVRPDKNSLLKKFVDLSEENFKSNKKNFSEMMQYLREEGDRRHIQVMALIESSNQRKRRRGRSDSD